MTMGVVAAPPAPTAPPPAAPVVADKPTHAPSPFIPPLRKQPEQAHEEPPAAVEAAPEAEVKPPAEEPPKPSPDSDDEYEGYESDGTEEYRVVVNGKESFVSVAKLVSAYQRNEGANAKFNEAKAMEHRAIGMMREMGTPDGLVRHMLAMKVDPYKLAEDIILARADYEAMTPEQREVYRYKRERAEWERQRSEETQRTQQTQQERETEAAQTRILDAMSGTLDRLQVKDPTLRNEIVSRAAGILRTDLADGVQTTPQQAIQEAWEDYRARLAAHARALPVGERVSEEERARLAEEARQSRVRVAPTAPRAPVQPRASDGKFAPDPNKQPERPKRFDMWASSTNGGKR